MDLSTRALRLRSRSINTHVLHSYHSLSASLSSIFRGVPPRFRRRNRHGGRGASSLGELPLNVVVGILRHLDMTSLLRVSQVCSALRRLAFSTPELWRVMEQRRPAPDFLPLLSRVGTFVRTLDLSFISINEAVNNLRYMPGLRSLKVCLLFPATDMDWPDHSLVKECQICWVLEVFARQFPNLEEFQYSGKPCLCRRAVNMIVVRWPWLKVLKMSEVESSSMRDVMFFFTNLCELKVFKSDIKIDHAATPYALSQLKTAQTCLAHLDLSLTFNSALQEIELGNFKRLHTLELFTFGVQYGLPSELASVSTLKALVTDCSFGESKWISLFRSATFRLETLVVHHVTHYGVGFTDAVLAILTVKQPRLRTLILSKERRVKRIKLTDDGLRRLASLRELEYVSIAYNSSITVSAWKDVLAAAKKMDGSFGQLRYLFIDTWMAGKKSSRALQACTRKLKKQFENKCFIAFYFYDHMKLSKTAAGTLTKLQGYQFDIDLQHIMCDYISNFLETAACRSRV